MANPGLTYQDSQTDRFVITKPSQISAENAVISVTDENGRSILSASVIGRDDKAQLDRLKIGDAVFLDDTFSNASPMNATGKMTGPNKVPQKVQSFSQNLMVVNKKTPSTLFK